ncbi:MAG: GHKL domain-containing protein [Spirochaetales bacterium]|nr:GHKL domain-containing protein [Spirochaetales bacterium]
MKRSKIREEFYNPPVLLQMILDGLEAGVMFIDTEYTILYMNKEKKENNPGIEPGMKCYKVFEEYGMRCPFCIAHAAMEKKIVQHNEEYVSIQKGVETPVHLRITAIPVCNESGDVLGAIEIAYNIENLYQTNVHLERLNKEYEHVIYALSHDLRAPLVSIEGFLAKLERGQHIKENDSIAEHCLHRIHVNVRMMNNLVKVLLDTSRIATGNLEIQQVDIQYMVNNLIEQYTGKIIATHAVVDVSLRTKSVRCDRIRVLQVFTNLLENSLEHCKNTENLRIEIGSKDNKFWVKDNGPGIPENFKDKVFEAFTQASVKSDHSHFGMGMNIVYKIIQKHGGKVWIESGPEGTIVFFTLSTIKRRI